MQVERHNNELLIRIPLTKNSARIQSIIDYLRYEELTSEININQKDADKLISAAKKGRWEKISKELGLNK
jgi:hypothetical protein